MPNVRLSEHSVIGTSHAFRGDLPPFNPTDDPDGGTVILGNGMLVTIVSAFRNWNAVSGLDMLYVFCPETGYHTHVTPADLGLPAL